MIGSWIRTLMCCLFMLIASPLVIADNSEDAENDNTSISKSSSTKTSSTKTITSTEPTSENVVSHDDKEKDTSSTGKATQLPSGSNGKPDDSEDKNTTILKVVVIQIGEEKLPIKDARVIITYGDATEFERKTDASGMAMMTGLPYGKVDVDVTSSGRQSDGGTLLLDEPNKTLTFFLKPRSVSD